MDAPAKVGLTSPRFAAFLVAQFLGAANDNAFKVTLVLLVLAAVPDEAGQVFWASLATALFPIPYLLFSPLAGWIADRLPKHRVLLAAKAPEIGATVIAMAGFATGSFAILYFALFLLAAQSAFFSPAKYGILPEVFEPKDLSLANGFLELTTNLAILLGSVAGVWVYGAFKDDLVSAGLAYVAVAVVGTAAILFAPRSSAQAPEAPLEWNVLRSAAADWRVVRTNRTLVYTLLGVAYFGFLGSVFLTLIPVFGGNVLGLAEERSGILLAVLSIGIGAGSVVAGRLSRGHVEIGLVPLGSIGISLFAFDLALFARPGGVALFGVPLRAVLDLVLLGLASGFFIVPLNALLQSRSPEGMKGRIVAFSNVLTFSAVLAAAVVPWLLSSVFGLETEQVILVVAAVTVAGTAYVMNLLPDFLVRLVLWLGTNTVYRIRVIGAENVPREGALFVANHVSWIDWLLVGAACDRMIRFLMYRKYWEWPALNWFFRRMGAVPVAAGDPPHKTEESLDVARRQIADGHVVCIFAEGAITRTGNLLKFRRGFERIARGASAPVVPVHLGNVWGSIFSYEGGRFFFKRPHGLRRPVTVAFGAPLPPTATAHEVRRAIQDLSAEAFALRRADRPRLAREILRTARSRWGSTFLVGSDGERVSFGEALRRASALRERLPAGAERVGILLPPDVPAALANLAVALAGRTAVNLETTPSGEWARFQLRDAGVTAVVTDRAWAERRGLAGVLDGVAVVEVAGPPAAASPLRELGLRLLPRTLAERLAGVDGAVEPDLPATILYAYPASSPDRPLGAMLTDENLISNLDAVRLVFDVETSDSILGCLPFSNALGLTTTLWLPLLSGCRVVYAGEALDDGGIGAIARRERPTLLPATPALLERLTATVAREDLSSLRYVASGGGDLPDEVRDAFAARFGVEPREGYGRPECTAVVSMNVPDVEHGRERQPGTRPGSTGHPLPGVSVRVVDPASGADLPPGAEGVLRVRGPNVMRGYVNAPDETSRALRGGWLDTGDPASVDEDGFLTVYWPESGAASDARGSRAPGGSGGA